MASFLSIVGQRFGHLTVLAPAGWVEKSAGRGRRKHTSTWRVLCDCGNEDVARRDWLHKCLKTRCKDCVLRPNQFHTKKQAASKIFRGYKKDAERRGKSWELSEEQFYTLIVAPCYYTGIPPQKLIKTREGPLLWNGVDRKDNGKGYTVDNCVPCSEIANMGKGTKTAEEFQEWLVQAAKFIEDQKAACSASDWKRLVSAC